MPDTQKSSLSQSDNPSAQPVGQDDGNSPVSTPNDEQKPSKKRRKPIFITGVLIVLALIVGATALYLATNNLTFPFTPPQITTVDKIEKFGSDEEFKQYLTEAESITDIFPAVGLGQISITDVETVPESSFGLRAETDTTAPSRISETNVQVLGIDEPDIVKTDGEQIYFSSTSPGYYFAPEPMRLETSILPPLPIKAETKIIDAFPPSELEKISSVEKSGNLLLSDDNLIVFSGNDIYGYDVSSPSSPTQKWSFELDSRTGIISSRLSEEKIYVVTRTPVGPSQPCPIPLISEPSGLSIPCTDVYHPSSIIPVDSTYTVMTIDPASGEVEDRVSFVGSTGLTVVYMSPNAIYITYPQTGNPADFFYTFFIEEGANLVPPEVTQKLADLKDLDISSAAKFVELETIMESYYATLSDDERLRIENEMANRLEDFSKNNSREFEKTGIIKIDNANLEVLSNGEVPGSPLNQFSLDEYKDNLRIATTLGRSMFNTGDSTNDVYVLDKNLRVSGQVQDLGLTERIYSVRFIENKGYVVTFRQIDPFYVIDLANPNNPQVKGELKIPGFSSYLHPINKDNILGVGEESNQVKISLFDVSNPSDPREVSKYQLDEYYTDVQSTHHAFLLDPENKIFFLPGSKGGYIFSYAGDELKLERAVSDIVAKRALYLDNYLYIVGEDKIVVLNEADWQEVNSLEL